MLRHGAAYFDDESNTPGRLTHKIIGDTANLQTVRLNLICTSFINVLDFGR